MKNDDDKNKRLAWKLIQERSRVCPECKGSTAQLDSKNNPINCKRCNGAGVIS